MDKNKRFDVIACLILTGLVCIYFSKFIFLNLAFGNYDSLSAIFQRRFLAFHSGPIKFWNPYLQAGYPFFAQAYTGYFSPLNILHIFLDFAQAQKWSIIMTILAGGISTYYYARYLSMTRPGAFLSAVVFMFCGYTVQFRELIGITLLPLVFLNYEKVLHENKIINLVATVILISLIFLNGNAQWVLYLFYAMFVYWLYDGYCDIRNSDVKKVLRNLTLLFSIVIFVILICSYQFLPTYELTKESIRGQGISYHEFSEWSMSPRHLIELLIPTFFGSYLDKSTNWGGVQYGTYLYVGILPLLLAVATFIFRTEKKVYLFWILSFICLVISFGRYLPFFKVIYHLFPGFKSFRDHARILWIFNFSMAILAGFGLDAILKKDTKDFYKRYSIFLKILLAILVVVTMLGLSFVFFREDIYILGQWIIKARYLGQPGHPLPYEFYLEKMKRIYNVLLTGLFTFVGLYGLSLISLSLFSKNTSRVASGVACGVVVLNLFWFGAVQDIPAADPKIFKNKPDYVSFLEKDKEIFRVFSLGGAVSPNLSMQYGYHEVKGYEQLMLNRFYKYIKMANLKDANPPCAKLFGFDDTEDISEYNRRFLDYLNVKYIISPRPIEDPSYRLEFLATEQDKRLLPPFGRRYKGESLFAIKKDKLNLPDILLYSDRIYIYKNYSYLPRVFLAYNYVTITSEDQILDMLANPEFDLRKSVIIEEDINQMIRSQTDTLPDTPNMVKIDNYSPDRVDITVDTTQKAFLVLHDIYYPGWKAYIDGQPTHIYRANYLFRALLIDKPGRHKISFIFRPRYLRLGLMLTILGTCLLFFSGYCCRDIKKKQG